MRDPKTIEDVLAELRAERDLADTLVDLSQCLVCVLDREGRIVRFNHACEEATGYASSEVLGRDAVEVVIPPEEAHEFPPFLAEIWATRKPSPREGHWMTRDGDRRLIAWANRPLLDEHGEVSFLFSTGLDITERERAAAELRRLAEEQAALRRVATLVAGGLEPEQIFQTVTAEMCRLLAIRSAILQRYENDEVGVIVGRWSDRPIRGFEIGTRVRLEEGLSATKVLQTGKAARVENYSGLLGDVARQMVERGLHGTVAVPVTVAGRTWGALVAALEEGESLPAETERRMADFAELVALALGSADAREQLTASRARIVEAGDAERRRLERNLHDGAQQRLVSLALTLRLVRAELPSNPAGAENLLLAAGGELEQALEELRELARGIHPAVLSEHGLGAGLESLADRASLPVEVSGVPAERFPPAVEAAAYYVASEALANVAKHAEASSASIRVDRVDGRALIEIADDGRGGADSDGGTGLAGLVDRVEALRGRLEVESPPGAGTRVLAEIPIEPVHGSA